MGTLAIRASKHGVATLPPLLLDRIATTRAGPFASYLGLRALKTNQYFSGGFLDHSRLDRAFWVADSPTKLRAHLERRAFLEGKHHQRRFLGLQLEEPSLQRGSVWETAGALPFGKSPPGHRTRRSLASVR